MKKKISKKRAVELFENGIPDKMDVEKFSSLQKIHEYLFSEIYEFSGKKLSIYLMVTSGLRR